MIRLILVLFLLLPALSCGSADSGGPNVILISLDTLAAKHLGCYGYERETSPNIDTLASNSILFLNAYSASAKTAESHMTMFTSLYPSVHGVWTRTDRDKVVPLGPDVTTLARILHQDGYKTVGFHGGGFVDGRFGFDRGFDSYRQADLGQARQWLIQEGFKQQFFLFFHTYHVHDPYTPRPPFDTMFDPDYRGDIIHDRGWLLTQEAAGDKKFNDLFWERVDKDDPADVKHLVALYDGAIRELDTQLGLLFQTIQQHAPDTIVILLADHGEEFGEHGDFLHRQLYDEVLKVPLMIWHPDGPHGVEVDDRVSLVDLTPTILSLLGLPPIEQFQGRPLLDARAAREGGEREVFSELPTFRLESLIDRDRKILHKKEVWELYDLARDPGETDDLNAAGDAPEGLAELRERLGRHVSANEGLAAVLAGSGEETLDEETLEQMRALGYIK